MIIVPILVQAVAADTEAVEVQPSGAARWKRWKRRLSRGELEENVQRRQRQREDIDLMSGI